MIPSDPQNVHDHGVVNSVRTKLESLPDDTRTDTMDSVRAYILDSEASPSTKADALETLESLSHDVHSTMGMSEQDVLRRVWGSCSTSDEKTMLVTQLADAVEDGGVVCSTGKMARMVGTFDATTDPIRPVWAVREEIASLAAKARDEGTSADEFSASCVATYVDTLGMSRDVISVIVNEYSPYI